MNKWRRTLYAVALVADILFFIGGAVAIAILRDGALPAFALALLGVLLVLPFLVYGGMRRYW